MWSTPTTLLTNRRLVQAWARSRVDGALGDRGLTWASTSHGFRHLAYDDVAGDGLNAERVEVGLLAREA